MKTITNFLAIPLNLAVKLVKMLQIRCNAFYGFLVGVHDAAKVLKGRPEPKQATPVPACNGMKICFPDENDKTRRPSEMKAAFSEFD